MSKRAARRSRTKSGRAFVKSGGFDFGFRRRAMFVSESDMIFNEALRSAEIVGCAYGFDFPEDLPSGAPSISLVAKKPEHLKRAFQCFEGWGADQDGDVIKLVLLLKNDGTYRLTIGPDLARMAYRFGDEAQLSESIFAGLTWIKTMDSTNPMVLEIKEHLHSRFAPVYLSGVGYPPDGKPVSPEFVTDIPGIPSIMLRHVRILTEAENSDDADWQFFAGGETPSTLETREMQPTSPVKISQSRSSILKTLFPVSWQRIKRSEVFSDFKTKFPDMNFKEIQIIQACINIILSRELTVGEDHYAGISDLPETVWSHVTTRIERADSSDIFSSVGALVLYSQLERDIEFTLRRHGITIKSEVSQNQQQFLRLGYGG